MLVALVAGCGRVESQRPKIRVAAAADLTFAFEEVGRAFERQTGELLTFSFGSTGLLAKQISEGAPFDVFAAANESFVDKVVEAGVCDGATKRPYARGLIALWSHRGGVTPPTRLEDLVDSRFARVAIANPEHAPYGLAAKQALETLSLWETLKPRLVFGENVRQTLQFAETRNVEAAIVALPLVIFDSDNHWFIIDSALHRPIDQALVVCGRGSNREGGEAFARFLMSEEGRAIMRRYGFVLPGETPVTPP